MNESLVQCSSVWERNLLADTFKNLEAANQDTNNICKDKEECGNGCLRRTVMSRLRSMGYNVVVCKSKWDMACGYPIREYEYINVILEGVGPMGKSERLIVDIDFRPQFEIARSASHYGAVLHILTTLLWARQIDCKKLFALCVMPPNNP